MDNCMICDRINLIKKNENPYFVRELSTGYVVIGDHQRIKGYTVFLCKEHATELYLLEPEFRTKFLQEMSIVAQAVSLAFHADKMNYELLGAGSGVHMHWHLFPRRSQDTPKQGPVWQLGAELHSEEFLPTKEELKELTTQLREALNQLIPKENC